MDSTPGQGRRTFSGQGALGLALLLAALFLGYRQLRPAAPTATRTARSGGRASATAEWPQIGLGRLAEPAPSARAGRRDLFSFGAAQEDDGTEQGVDGDGNGRSGRTPSPLPEPVATPNPQVTPPLAPRLVAINLKYVGTLEAAGGLKVAVLLTDRNEILYGQVGQQVANRFKIVRIGLESVEVLDEGSGQSRRIPFKGN